MWKTMSRPSSTASAPAEQITSVLFTSSTCGGRHAGAGAQGQRQIEMSLAGSHWHMQSGIWWMSWRHRGVPRSGSCPQLPAEGLMSRAGCLTVRKTEDSSAPVTR